MPAYTPHATWVAGDVPVAADLNNWETGIDAACAHFDTLAGSGFRAYRSSSDQTLTGNAYTTLQYQTENYDSGGEYDNATDYDFTAAAAGIYAVEVALYSGHATAAVADGLTIELFKNGSALCVIYEWRCEVAGNRFQVHKGSAIVKLAAADVLLFKVYINDVSNWTAGASATQSYIAVQRLA